MPTKSNNVFGALALLTLLVISLAFTVLAITYCRKGKDIFRAEKKAADQSQQSHLQPLEAGSWRFIVSGDSRNCGDMVMPAIAAHSASRFQPSFYWHLGDLRAIYMVDEDMAFADHQSDGKKLACGDYLKQAWPDFVKHQIYPFGRTPFYLGLGNHEVIPPKGYPLGSPQSLQPEINSSQFTAYFADWLLAPAVKAQRAKDHDCDKPSPAPCVISPRNYYHWIQGGVDFIYLDNASHILGPAQLSWFKDRIKKAEKDSAVRTLIVGMHEALPDSISTDHAMCDPDLVKRYGAKYPFQQSCDEGRQAYRALLDFQNDRPEKQVFVLASHSHYYMDGIFKIASKPVAERLRGFIVGTAGAIRYKLPDDFLLSNYAETDTYGYLLGTVDAKGDVTFQFQHVTESDVPPDVHQRYQSSFVSWCFNENKDHPRQPAQTHDDCAKTPPAEPEATAPAKQ